MSQVSAVTLDGSETSLSASAIEELRSRLGGDVIDPSDARYEVSRQIWNGLIDRRPALIARCATSADVVEAVRFGRESDLLLAVRGGGHGVAGNAVCDGGLVIDLAPMTGVEVDAERGLVRAQAGCQLGHVDAATQPAGLAVPLGVVSETGIAGLTLSGGMGWLRRRDGLSCDNVVSAEVVTADGSLVTASEDENAELLWGLRGGGGNFGIVTTFEFRAHPVAAQVFTLFILYPGDRRAEVLRAYRDYMHDAADDVGVLAFVGRVPAGDPFPAEIHGQPFAAIGGPHPGDVAEGMRVLRPLRELGEPLADLSGPMSWAEAQTLLDEDYPSGKPYYWKSLDLESLTDESVDRIVEHADAAPAGPSTVDVWYQGGAMGRVAADATAFGSRAPFLLGYEANFESVDEADANIAWARGCIEDLKPLSTGGAYLNFPGFFEEGEDLLRASYGEANYDRLVSLKNEWDPTNVFRLNGNIMPSV